MAERVEVSLATVVVVAGTSAVRNGAQLGAGQHVHRTHHAELPTHTHTHTRARARAHTHAHSESVCSNQFGMWLVIVQACAWKCYRNLGESTYLQRDFRLQRSRVHGMQPRHPRAHVALREKHREKQRESRDAHTERAGERESIKSVCVGGGGGGGGGGDRESE